MPSAVAAVTRSTTKGSRRKSSSFTATPSLRLSWPWEMPRDEAAFAGNLVEHRAVGARSGHDPEVDDESHRGSRMG